MDRIEFRNRAESISTKQGYDKAFKKFDSWLDVKQIQESKFLELLEGFEVHQKYNLLQEVIDFIKGSVSPRVARGYFETIFMYLVLVGSPLDYTQKKLRLKFPRAGQRRFEGLDRNKIDSIMRTETSVIHQGYYSLLYGAGLRETEALLVTPSMFEFSNITRLKLPAEITKFKIERETFIAEIPASRIKKIIELNDYRNDDLIFIEKYDELNTLIGFEKHFARIRSKAGLDTLNRKLHQQNDITLHSFRSFFITVLTDNDLESFAHAITGHRRYMDTYYRNSLDSRIEKFSKVSDKINF